MMHRTSTRLSRAVLRGAAAGAAGTTALNAVTYLDMLIRARPASSTPDDTVERAAAKAGLAVPGKGEDRQNRVTALGSLTGLATGVTVGAGYGLARGLGWRPPAVLGAAVTASAAIIGANGPMAGLGVSNPRTWTSTDWVADLVPHLAYGLVTALTYSTGD
jgi:hypothetical protein